MRRHGRPTHKINRAAAVSLVMETRRSEGDVRIQPCGHYLLGSGFSTAIQMMVGGGRRRHYPARGRGSVFEVNIEQLDETQEAGGGQHGKEFGIFEKAAEPPMSVKQSWI